MLDIISLEKKKKGSHLSRSVYSSTSPGTASLFLFLPSFSLPQSERIRLRYRVSYKHYSSIRNLFCPCSVCHTLKTRTKDKCTRTSWLPFLVISVFVLPCPKRGPFGMSSPRVAEKGNSNVLPHFSSIREPMIG